MDGRKLLASMVSEPEARIAIPKPYLNVLKRLFLLGHSLNLRETFAPNASGSIQDLESRQLL